MKPLSSTAILLIFVSMLLSSCQMAWTPKSPPGYVIPRPKKIVLDKKLNEISGLNYLEKENVMIAIADDKKKIYKLTTEGQMEEYESPNLANEQEDFEDVVKVDSTVYALISNGTIISVKNSDSGLVLGRYPFWSTDKNDFETLYYDPSAKGLIMVCKQCASEKGKEERTAYRFDLQTGKFDTMPYYTISSKSVRDQLKDGKVDFHPSAAAIHPIEKRLYMLASSGNLLIVTDLKGKVASVYRMNPSFYPQAEGIAFASNGDMYISNEAKLGKPTLLVISYKPPRK